MTGALVGGVTHNRCVLVEDGMIMTGEQSCRIYMTRIFRPLTSKIEVDE